MSGSIDIRIVVIGVAALLIALHDHSPKNAANLFEVFSMAQVNAPCAIPVANGKGRTADDITGSIGRMDPQTRSCR